MRRRGRRRRIRLRLRLHRLALAAVVAYALALGVQQQADLWRLAAETRRAQAELARIKARREALEAAIRRWHDPEVLELEARRRLGLARPGEIQYITVPGPGLGDEADGGEARPPR